MATFELNSDMLNNPGKAGTRERFEQANQSLNPLEGENTEREIFDFAGGAVRPGPIRQESVIAMKIYDSCRRQDCLDEEDLGPARSACDQYIGLRHYKEGEIIIAPDKAASVSIDDLRTRKIIIVNKRHNPFKRGFWDIDLKYVFEYTLTFREAGGHEIGTLLARSMANSQVTLFGSVGSDIVIATDLLADHKDESPVLSHDPFVLVEAKAVPLSAKLRHFGRRPKPHDPDECDPAEVLVTIGLFSIIKLYRIVTLLVESRGFSVPRPCEPVSPVNMCKYFDHLPFPMDVFAPPQKKEFESGVSGNIPHDGFGEAALEAGE